MDKLIYLLSTGDGEDYGVEAVVAEWTDAYTIADRWNTEQPPGDPRFRVEPVRLIDFDSAGRSPFGRKEDL